LQNFQDVCRLNRGNRLIADRSARRSQRRVPLLAMLARAPAGLFGRQEFSRAISKGSPVFLDRRTRLANLERVETLS
jgi:hypothetical protein